MSSQTRAGTTQLRVATAEADRLAPRLFELAVARGWKLKELRPERQTLEDLFVRITESEDGARELAQAV